MRIKIIACLISSLFLATITTLAMAANTSNFTPNSINFAHRCVSSIKSTADCVTHGRCAQCLKEVDKRGNHWIHEVKHIGCLHRSWFFPANVVCMGIRYELDVCAAAVGEIKQACKI